MLQPWVWWCVRRRLRVVPLIAWAVVAPAALLLAALAGALKALQICIPEAFELLSDIWRA